MELLLKRKAKKEKYTIGDLYIDGQWFSNTLEDTERGLTNSMTDTEIAKIKVYGETAIPTGTYKITMDVISPRFKNRSWAKPYDGKLPRLIAVPGFEGVLIHVGNDSTDSSGCILVGMNTIVGKITNSTATFHQLMSKLQGQKDITITIE